MKTIVKTSAFAILLGSSILSLPTKTFASVSAESAPTELDFAVTEKLMNFFPSGFLVNRQEYRGWLNALMPQLGEIDEDEFIADLKPFLKGTITADYFIKLISMLLASHLNSEISFLKENADTRDTLAKLLSPGMNMDAIIGIAKIIKEISPADPADFVGQFRCFLEGTLTDERRARDLNSEETLGIIASYASIQPHFRNSDFLRLWKMTTGPIIYPETRIAHFNKLATLTSAPREDFDLIVFFDAVREKTKEFHTREKEKRMMEKKNASTPEDYAKYCELEVYDCTIFWEDLYNALDALKEDERFFLAEPQLQ